MRKFLQSKNIYMLVVLLMTVAALSFMHTFREASIKELFFGVVTYQFPYDALFASICWFMGMLLLFIINEQTKLLEQRSTLPATIYFLLTVATFWHFPSVRISLAVVLTILGIRRLMRSYDEGTGNNTLFDTGALLTTSILLVPEFVLLWILGFVSTIFYGKQIGRGVIAYLIGVGVILGLGEGIYYLVYGSPMLIQNTITSLDLDYHSLFNYSTLNWVIIGIILFLLITALIKLWGSPRSFTIPLRKAKDTILLSLLFAIISAIIFPDFWYSGIVYLLAIPLSLLYSNFIIHTKNAWISSLYFLIILLVSGVWFAIGAN